MSHTQHTPGPWRVCSGYSDTFTRRVPIKVGSAPAITIAETLGMPKGDLADANAEYIVRAANTHAVLLAALKRLVHEVLWITDQTDNGRLDAIEHLHRDGIAIETARAAIAAATKETK